MIFNIENFVLIVDPFIGMRAKAMHVTISIRSTSVWEKNRDLMKSFRTQTPKVPYHIGISYVSLRISLLAMNKVRKLYWILNKENWSIIAYHVKVSLFCVKFKSKASGISLCIRRAFFTSYSWESSKQWSSFANSIEELCFCVPMEKFDN